MQQVRVGLLAVHARLKNFKCEKCEYAASHSSNLKQHVLVVHEKVNNFKCELCEYAASNASNLKRHVLSVHS